MKILHINHSPNLDGSSYALLNILRGELLRGIIPIVILPFRGAMFNEVKKMGVDCYVYPFYMDVYPRIENLKDFLFYIPRLIRTLFFNSRVKAKLFSYVRKNAVDIIHSNSSVIHWGADVAEKFSIPHVWHFREFQDIGLNYTPIGGGMIALKCKALRQNNHCIAITKKVFEHYCLENKKDTMIYDGVFFQEQCNIPINLNKKKYFLYVGALTKCKGVFDAIHAFELIAKDFYDIELWLVGRDYDNVAEVVDQSIFSSRIKLLGFRHDVYDLMKQAKALLVTSFNEGFGFITAEAMINGCVVIGRNTTGTKEQFDNGVLLTNKEIGLRFMTNEELEQQMRLVCENPISNFEEMLYNAKKSASFYTVENNVNQLLIYYNKVLGK